MAQGVTYQNANGEIIEANPAAQRILGLTLNQMQGKTSRDKNWRAIHEDGSDFSGEKHPGMVALKTGKEQNNVIMGIFNPSKREYRWIKINASPQFRNSGKRPYQVFTTFDDITAERNAQHSLNELYTKYQNIIHTANIAIFELDKDGKYIFVNSAWEALLGYKSNEVLGKDKELVLSRGESSPLLFNELKQGQITHYNQERRYHAKNGKIIWCDLYVAANKDLKGKLKSIVGVIVDITTKKETETKIREKERLVSEALAEVERSEKLLNETGRLAKVGGWELDLTTMTPYFSDETYRIHELPTGEPPKLEDGMGFYAPEFQPTVKRVVNEALENHTPYDVEVRFITAKGRSIWVRTFGRVELKNGKAIRLYGAIQDITELKESNLRLQESKTKYKDLVEYSYDLIWTIDATGTITFINQACKSIYGYEPEALIGQSFFDFVPKEQAEKDNAIFTKSMKEGEVIINYDSQFIHKDGHIVQLLTNARKLRDESGNFIGTSGISKDVTEQKRKEQELKASEKRFKTIVEGAPDPIFIQIDKRFAYLNKHAVELFGAVDEKELLGKPVLESFHPNFHKRALERIKSLNADKTNRQGPFEQLLIQLNGNQIWVETKGQPIIYNGENGGLVFVRDITSRKKAEKELRESKTLLENINNNLPGAVIKYKLFPNGKDELIYVSEGAKAIWGVNPETAMQDNLKIWEQIDEEYIAIVKHSIEVSFQTLDPWHVVFKNNRPDGAFNWIEATGMPQKQEDGSVIYNAILLDVTSRKELENEMLRYKESLQDLTTEMTLIEEKQRKEIAANIHDHLSQSLVISKMKLTDIAKEAHTNEKRKEINTIIGHISEALENTRKITYDLSPPILYELGLIEAVYWLSEKIENENQIKVRFKTELNEINLTEPNLILIYRAIQEILANAIKYSGAEEINIFFTTYDNGLKIVIRDEGSGFRKSALNAPKKSNTGFGLFAVKQRIENLRGTFIINSSIGKGTEVKMFVPIKPTKLL